jgi:hypothetical protein
MAQRSLQTQDDRNGEGTISLYFLAMNDAAAGALEEARHRLAEGQRAARAAGYINWRFNLLRQMLGQEAKRAIETASSAAKLVD